MLGAPVIFFGHLSFTSAQQAHLPEFSSNAFLNSQIFSPAIAKAISMVIHHLNLLNEQLLITHVNSWR